MVYDRDSGIMQLCACIILHIIGEAAHNLMSSAYFVLFASKSFRCKKICN